MLGLALIAFIPILVVCVLMVSLDWPSTKAMPVGFILAVIIAAIFWNMPANWLAAATVSGIINTIDILLIVYGALLILGMLRESGGIDGIANSMAYVSTDRRVQVILIGFLMGAFFEGAAGFGTPAAVAAPLLVGIGFPPLVAAMVALIGNSTPVAFGAVGTPIVGGFSNLADLMTTHGYTEDLYTFLREIGAFHTILTITIGTFIPLAMVCTMTLIMEGSIKKGLESWKLALFGGLIFTIPQTIIATFVGPELPSLLGALIAIPLFIMAVRANLFMPKDNWDFPDKSLWEDDWEGEIKAGTQKETGDEGGLSVAKSWAPYIIIGVLLLMSRLDVLPFKKMLSSWAIGLSNIFGTDIGNSVKPLYNPGVVPFMLVALIIPSLHNMEKGKAKEVWIATVKQVIPTAIALFFALSMTYVMMNSGGATKSDSMLIVIAKALAGAVGKGWYFFAPMIGTLGSFISGSATVSDVMFGALQFDAAIQAGVPVIPTLALQALGAAAGNMICVHNVVAALTTVGLVGSEGKVIKNNLFIALGYGILTAIVASIVVFVIGIEIF